jgi:hypothetical protein
LPVVGWSTVGGDLRAPHFFGLHALQLLPLAAWLLARYGTRLSTTARTQFVWIVGLGYLGFVGILTWQAKRGQSIVHPDARTLAAFATLLIAATLATSLVLRHGRRTEAVGGAPAGAQPV